jgi:hypothetical protein
MAGWIKKGIGAILILIATQLPRIIGWRFALPQEQIPDGYAVAKYVMECVLWAGFIVYLIWWLITSKKE